MSYLFCASPPPFSVSSVFLFCPNFSFYLFLLTFLIFLCTVCLLFLLFIPSFSILLSPSPKPFLFFSRFLPPPDPPPASFILPRLPLSFPILLSSLPSFLPRLTVHDVLPLEPIHLCLFCSAFSPLLTLLPHHPSIPPSPLCADWDSGRPAVTRQQARCSLASSQALSLPPARG